MGRHIGEITHPDWIGPRDGELPGQVIRGDRQRVTRMGGEPVASFLLGGDLMGPHETRYPMAATGLPLLAQSRLDARTAVRLSARLVDSADLLQETALLLGAGTRRMVQPGKNPLRGTCSTRQRLVRRNWLRWSRMNLVSHPSSFEKIPMAFLRWHALPGAAGARGAGGATPPVHWG